MSGKHVTFPSENTAGDGMGFLTGNAESAKGLIVLHEWWGHNDQIKQQGEDIAKEGNFLVLVADLYRGKVAIDRETAGHYMGELDWQGAVLDIKAAAKFLLANGCKKVGVTGFCMGGALSLACAAMIPEVISAAAPFYGIPSAELADLTTIRIPVQGHYAEDDHVVGFSSKKDYDALNAKLKSANVPFELFEYKACHGFCNPMNLGGPWYNAELAKLAMGRMMSFMNSNLK